MNNSRVLLISTPVISERESFYIPDFEIPLNVCYLAAYLEREGFEVAALDMNVAEPGFALEKFAAEMKPDIVGFSAYTPFINTACELAARVKAAVLGVKTIIGGYHASALPEDTLNEFASFDFLARGEGELTLAALAGSPDLEAESFNIPGLYYRSADGKVTGNTARNQAEDIDSMPFPARGMLDQDKYRVSPINYVELPTTGILASRGCEMRCAFCSQSVFRGARVRSAGNIIEEVEQCRRDFGVKGFRFYDDNLTAYRETCEAFCEGLLKRNIRISWNCFSRVDSVDAELLSLMKRAGCHQLKFGVETGTERMLDVIKKRIGLEQSREAVRLAARAGIESQVSVILGLPGETREEILETIRFVKSISPDLAGFNMFKPLPGSPLFTSLEREGQLLHRDWPDYSIKQSRPIVKGGLAQEELEELLSYAYLSFFIRPRYFLQRLKWLARSPKREALRLTIGVKYILSTMLRGKKQR